LITISIDPIIFSIGHFMLRWYSLILVIAVGIGLWLTGLEAERKGLNKTEIYDAAIWIMLAGLLGARLFHVIDHWSHEYVTDPIRALYIWEGGLAIWGAIIGGLIAVVVIAGKRRWKLPRVLDAFVPGVVLAQAIGRVACIITGDAMGPPTAGPFGIAYTNPNAMVPQLGVFYTPMPVYEIIANMGIFALVWSLGRRKLADGNLFLIYVTLYSFERFLLGYTSAYMPVAYGLNQSQLIALGLLVVVAVFLAFRAVTGAKVKPLSAR
jgi:phosphatidylglycerol:prolipoprotein diacylglycerol transferase